MDNFNHKQLVQDVFDGQESALKAYQLIDELEKSVKLSKDAIKPEAIEEASKFDSPTFEFEEGKFTFKRGGKQWDFKGVKEWKDAKKSLTEIEGKLKAAWELNQKGLMAVDEVTGDIQDLPTVSFRADSISVKRID